MKCNDGTKRLLTAVLIGLFVFGFTVSSVDEIFIEMWQQDFGLNCWTFEQETHKLNQPSATTLVTNQTQPDSPLAYLFQLLFILFLISPPLIVIMLCLIWKELKKRNELK